MFISRILCLGLFLTGAVVCANAQHAGELIANNSFTALDPQYLRPYSFSTWKIAPDGVWMTAYGAPQVVQKTGEERGVAVMLSGNHSTGDAIMQHLDVSLQEGRRYRIEISARLDDGGTTAKAGYLRLQAVRHIVRCEDRHWTGGPGEVFDIGTVVPEGDGKAVASISWTAPSDRYFLVISARSESNGAVASFLVDDVTLRADGPAPIKAPVVAEAETKEVAVPDVANTGDPGVPDVWMIERAELAPMAKETAAEIAAGRDAIDRSEPNPFNDVTTISFHTVSAGRVLLTVHDGAGREVARLMEGEIDPGQHEARWDASGSAPGIYYARLCSGAANSVRKIVLVR